MNNLKLPNPKMMDVAVPANMKVGFAQDGDRARRAGRSPRRRRCSRGNPMSRSSICGRNSERERHGTIPGALHVPYPKLREISAAGGMLHELAGSTSSGSCSSAPTASARPWRCRRRRRRVSPRPATSGAALPPGRKPAGRWRPDRVAPRPVLALSATARCGYKASALSNPSGYCLAAASVDCFTVHQINLQNLTLVD